MAQGTEIVPIKLDDNTTLQARVINLKGEEDVGIKDWFFSTVMGPVNSLGISLANQLRKMEPDKATVEFGIALAAKEGQLTALLAQGGADVSMKITLEFENKKKE